MSFAESVTAREWIFTEESLRQHRLQANTTDGAIVRDDLILTSNSQIGSLTIYHAGSFESRRARCAFAFSRLFLFVVCFDMIVSATLLSLHLIFLFVGFAQYLQQTAKRASLEEEAAALKYWVHYFLSVCKTISPDMPARIKVRTPFRDFCFTALPLNWHTAGDSTLLFQTIFCESQH